MKRTWILGLESSVAVSWGGLRKVTSLRLSFLPLGTVVRGDDDSAEDDKNSSDS